MTQVAKPGYWRRLVAFGDSFSDSGAGYVDGNGPTAIACAAEKSGISFVPATNAAPPDAGLNFAVSGAKTGGGEGERIKDALLGRGMRTQAQDYMERVKSRRASLDPEHTLFFIAGGLNDNDQATEWTIANLETIVRELHVIGARHFLVAKLPTRIPAFGEVGRRLNPAIAEMTAKLSLALTDARVGESRWGEYFDQVMVNASAYGLTNTTDACAGRALFDEDSRPCGDPDRYFYYHRDHPSFAVHRAVAAQLCRDFLRAVPV